MLDPKEVREVNESTGGAKGQKLARFDLIPQEALWTVAELYGIGAKKYAENNWRRGYNWNLSHAALSRHLALFWMGEDIDPETELPHLAAVVFHAFALMTFMKEHPELDNRPHKSVKRTLIDKQKLPLWRKLLESLAGTWFK